VNMDPAELERVTHRKLSQLPAPRAPRSLMPRVLVAVERESRRPWYARAWRTWPGEWQAVSAATALAVIIGAALWLPGVNVAVPIGSWTSHLSMPGWLTGMAASAATVWDAGRVMWRVLVEPVIGYISVFVLLMSAACVAFGTALDRVALGGASKS
jgi:hypothetical protein